MKPTCELNKRILRPVMESRQVALNLSKDLMEYMQKEKKICNS
jgi:hypothetical protein